MTMKAHVHLPVRGINYTKYDTKYDLLKQVLFLQNRGATHRKAQDYIIDNTATWQLYVTGLLHPNLAK